MNQAKPYMVHVVYSLLVVLWFRSRCGDREEPSPKRIKTEVRSIHSLSTTSLSHSLTTSLTHSLTTSLTHSLPHSLIHLLPRDSTTSLPTSLHSLTHYLTILSTAISLCHLLPHYRVHSQPHDLTLSSRSLLTPQPHSLKSSTSPLPIPSICGQRGVLLSRNRAGNLHHKVCVCVFCVRVCVL